MRSIQISLVLLLALVTSGGAAQAQALAICHDGGPGSTKQAAESVETFLRHMEGAAELTGGSLSGEYHTTGAACASFVGAQAPPLAVVDLATFLRHRTSWQLTPIAHLGDADATRYHVLVREGGGIAGLAALAGKTAIAATPADETFIKRIVLGGGADTLGLLFTGRPLKGLRKVAREQAAATLVDAEAFAHMGELDLPAKLISIHQSEGLPGLTLVRVGAHAGAHGDLISKVSRALPQLCSGDGAKLCKTFKIKAFKPASAGRFDALAKTYDK